MNTTFKTGLSFALVAALGAGAALAQATATTPEAEPAPPAAAPETELAQSGPVGMGPGRGGLPGLLPLELYDTDGDGSITQGEIEAARVARFEAADADGDGALSAAELVAMEEAVRQELMTARAQAQVTRFDDSGDGLLQAEELAARQPQLAPIFDRLDADNDGAITQAEMAAAREARGDGMGRGGHGRHGRHGGEGSGFGWGLGGLFGG